MNDKIIKAIKKLKEGQDDIKLTYKDMLKKIDDIEKDLKNSDDLNTKELFSAIADNLARYTIQEGYWFYNGRSLGIRAEGIPGKDGKDGAPGKDAVDPIIKIGKVEEGEASVKLRKKDGVIYFDFKVPRGNPGFMGFDAKINGHNTIEIVEGDNIELQQDGNKLVINSIGGPGGGTSNYEKLKNLPSINGVELIGNKTTKDLGIEAGKEVHIGTDEPTGEELIWIDPSEEADVIPTKTSQLENDSKFVNEEYVDTAIQNALEVIENGTY